MRYLSIVALVISLAAAVGLGLEVQSLRESVARANASAAWAGIDPPGQPGPPAVAPKFEPAPRVLPAPTVSGADGARVSQDMAAQMTAIERRISGLEQTLSTLLDGISQRGILLPGSLVLRDVDGVAGILGLDAGRKARLERTRQEAVRGIEELYRTANDEGVTWDQVVDRRVALPAMGDAPAISTSDPAAIRRFEESHVPGGTESFGEARRRLVRDGLQRLREALEPGQQSIWDRARTEGLLEVVPGSASAPPPDRAPTDAERIPGTGPR